MFTALDPFEGSASRPMSLNGYSWVMNNPINRVDPTGMFDWASGTVEQGDWLRCIAREGTSGWNGMQPPPESNVTATLNTLLSQNPRITNPNYILPGWTIAMPESIRQTGLSNRNKSCRPSSITPPATAGSDCTKDLPCPPNFERRGSNCVPVVPTCQPGYVAVYHEYPDSSGFFAGRGYYTCECRFKASDGSCRTVTPGGEPVPPPPTACETVANHMAWALEGVGERGSTIGAFENALIITLLQLDYDNNIDGFRDAVDACGSELNQHYSRDCQLSLTDWKDLLLNTAGIVSAFPNISAATKRATNAISATDWGITTATTEANIYGYLDTLRNTFGTLTPQGAMLNIVVTMGNSCGWREVE